MLWTPKKELIFSRQPLKSGCSPGVDSDHFGCLVWCNMKTITYSENQNSTSHQTDILELSSTSESTGRTINKKWEEK